MKKIKSKRSIIQIAVLIAVVISASCYYLLSLGISIPWVTETLFHYICPTCGVVNLYEFIASPSFGIREVMSESGIIICVTLILALLFGPITCGFICPFGTVQDLLARVGKKLFASKYNHFISNKLDKKLGFLRYIILVMTIILIVGSNIMLIEALNPYHAFLGFFNGKTISIAGLGMLVIVILTSLFIQRPWCKYLCPYGAFLGLFNRIKLVAVHRNTEGCSGCKKCNKVCPMGIDIHEEKVVRDVRCISCMVCIGEEGCPRANVLGINNSGGDKVKSKKVAGMLAGLAILGALGAVIIGNLEVGELNISKEPLAVSAGINILPEQFKDGTYEGEAVGYRGTIKVEIEIVDSALERITCTEQDETKRFFNKAYAVIPNEIIENQSTKVDTVSGATYSSAGIINAVNDALSLARNDN